MQIYFIKEVKQIHPKHNPFFVLFNKTLGVFFTVTRIDQGYRYLMQHRTTRKKKSVFLEHLNSGRTDIFKSVHIFYKSSTSALDLA